jgi:hypothetical protein
LGVRRKKKLILLDGENVVFAGSNRSADVAG